MPSVNLAVIAEIRRLKYRYPRCVDRKLRDEIGGTFTADATVGYGTRMYGKPPASTPACATTPGS